MYIKRGAVKISVTSENGREAVIALLGPGDFFGEGCLAGNLVRDAAATALTPTTVLIIDRREMRRLLHTEGALSDRFTVHMLKRVRRVEEDLVDQLFNDSERRLARVLLLLARYGKKGTPSTVIPKVSQETLAEMIGTTRSRVNHFMNKFRKHGFIRYNGRLKIHSSLLNVLLHE
jgi:CRP-like cAMP-binding protein